MNPALTPTTTDATVSTVSSELNVVSRPQVDARGVRFGAATVLLISATALVALDTAPLVTWALALTQLTLFIIGAWRGPQASPVAVLFRRVVAPRLRSLPQPEDAAPPRFAQAVGTLCIGLAVVGLIVGSDAIALTGLGLTVAASALNAGFGLCLGCEMYLAFARLRARLRH